MIIELVFPESALGTPFLSSLSWAACPELVEGPKSSRRASIANNMTHITTNLNAEEIEDRYGNRVRSRLREMVNVIGFDKNTKDKRK